MKSILIIAAKWGLGCAVTRRCYTDSFCVYDIVRTQLAKQGTLKSMQRTSILERLIALLASERFTSRTFIFLSREERLSC